MIANNKFNFDAVIWDLDGTITDTEYIHAKTEVELFKTFGIDITVEEIVKRFAGVRVQKIFQTVFEENNKSADYDELKKVKWKMMKKIVREENIQFMKGAKELIFLLSENNIKMAVASSSIKSYIRLLLRNFKIIDRFQFIISGEDVISGKPDPEIFICAAQALKVENEKCLVIEDATAGVLAAQSANMKCIAVGDHVDKNILKEKSIYANTLEKVDIEFINKMF